MNAPRPRWSERVKLVTSLLLLALFIYLLFRFSIIFPPLILAIILAYILSPLVQVLQKRLKVRRVFAIFLSYLIMLVFLIILPASLTPYLMRELSALNLDLQLWIDQFQAVLGKPIQVAGQTVDGAALFQELIASLTGVVEPIFGHTLGFAFDVITSFVWMIFIFVVSFYLVKDSYALREWTEGLVPPVYKDDFVLMREKINRIWSAFFRGQLILAGVVSAIFTVIGLLLGLPFAFAMGVLAGLLEFLPSIGHGIWLTMASLLAFSLGSTWLPIPNWAFVAIIISLHLFFQQFDLNYLIPRIIGHSVHLPPLVVILGIVAGAVFAGVLGIPLAAPVIASARIIGRYIYANLFDLDPFSEAIAPLPPPDPNWWKPGRPKEPGFSTKPSDIP